MSVMNAEQNLTKDAIKKAIKNPRSIDLKLVDAQQARRVLDRLLGYQISPILWAKVRKGLSAGRVQSVTTKLICEKEREINEFVPKEYWSLEIEGKTEDKESITFKFVSFNNEKIDSEAGELFGESIDENNLDTKSEIHGNAATIKTSIETEEFIS